MAVKGVRHRKMKSVGGFTKPVGRASVSPMTTVDEIAPDVFRLSIYVPEFDMQFNHFLVRDEQPLLFHAGLKRMFPALREAVAKLIDPTRLRHIAWSHFESDECGALNEWLQLAPAAQPVCTLVGKLVSVDDFSIRPAFGMTPDDSLNTGKYRYRFHRSPHAAVTSSDLIEPSRKAMQQMQQGPLAGYLPYTRQTEGVLRSLAALKPQTLAVMHGSSYVGQSERLLVDLASVIKENFDQA
jgi:hypothetical protein